MKRALRSRVLSVVLAAAVALTSFALPGAVKQGKAYYYDGEYESDIPEYFPESEDLDTPKLSVDNDYDSEDYHYYQAYTGITDFNDQDDYRVYYEYSNNSKFAVDSKKKQWVYNTYESLSSSSYYFSVDDDVAAPGETIYVRAYIAKKIANASSTAENDNDGVYYQSPFSNVLSFSSPDLVEPTLTLLKVEDGEYKYQVQSGRSDQYIYVEYSNNPEFTYNYDSGKWERYESFYGNATFSVDALAGNPGETIYVRAYVQGFGGHSNNRNYNDNYIKKYSAVQSFVVPSLPAPVISEKRTFKSGNNIVSHQYETNDKIDFLGESIPVYYEYSNDPNFKSDEDSDTWVNSGNNVDGKTFSIYNGRMKPGETIYVRTYTEKNYNTRNYYYYGAGTSKEAYSATLSFTVPVQNAEISETIVRPKSITLKLGSTNANGFIIYRKSGKGKFKQIGKTEKLTFVDKGLIKGKKYTYRVKSYYYNEKNGQTLNSDSYTYTRAVTAGSSLNLRAGASGKKVKLNWQKVKGAKKYVIYRAESSSASDTEKNGFGNDYSNYKKVKTLKKKKKSWTDKKVNASDSYSYKVRAYLTGDLFVEEGTGIDLSFGPVGWGSEDDGYSDRYYDENDNIYYGEFDYDEYETNLHVRKQRVNDNTLLVSWDKVQGATGYQVTKDVVTYDKNTKKEATNEIVVSELSAKQTSIRLTNDAAHEKTTYRIYAKSGNSFSTPYVISFGSRLSSTKVTAVPTANGIQISWDSVPGASYYTVTRYEYADLGTYNANTKDYEYSSTGGSAVRKILTTQPLPDAYIAQQKKEKLDYYTEHGAANGEKLEDFTETQHIVYDGTDGIEYVFTADQRYRDEDKEKNLYSDENSTKLKTERNPARPRPSDQITGNTVLDQYVKYGTRESEAVGPKPGVRYYYVVTAYNDDQHDYHYDENDPNKNPNNYILRLRSYNVKNIASASWGASVTAPKTSVKKLKAKKNSVKVKIKKSKAAGAEYIIYRSTSKKKGSFQVAGYTNKTTFTDTGLNKGTKYYYKVATSVRNSAGQYITSTASKVKKVKTKGKKAKAGSKKSKAKSKAKKSGSKKKGGKKSSKKKSGKKKK